MAFVGAMFFIIFIAAMWEIIKDVEKTNEEYAALKDNGRKNSIIDEPKQKRQPKNGGAEKEENRAET